MQLDRTTNYNYLSFDNLSFLLFCLNVHAFYYGRDDLIPTQAKQDGIYESHYDSLI